MKIENNDTALILTPGGMRNAYISGVLEGLQISPNSFKRIYTASSSAFPGAFYIAGQNHRTEQIWVEELTSPKVFSTKRMMLGKRAADTNYLVDVACRELNIHKACNSTTELYVARLEIETGTTEFVQATENNFSELMKATCAFPLAARYVSHEGKLYADGGTEETLPVHVAYRDGFRKILVISSISPVGVDTYGLLWQWLAFPKSPSARNAINRRSDSYQKGIQFLQWPPPDVKTDLVSPKVTLPAQLFSRAPEKIRDTYNIGFHDGVAHREEINTFLNTESLHEEKNENNILKTERKVK